MSKKREKFFLKNGGLLLEKLVSSLNGKPNPIRNFSIEELQQATNSYSTSLIFDSWTYSDWYKGAIARRFVAVRKFRDLDEDWLDYIMKEIAFATQMSAHKNVLKLLGCCLETELPVLVYEYPANGLEVLYDLIHPSEDGMSRQHLPWKSRLRIAGEVANVIAYLHTAFPTPIIHREVNLSFLFLDQDCVPKLSNFFFAIALPKGKEYVVDRVMGIEGYIDPDYEMTGMVTEKVDVFSFGKLLLEVLTGEGTGSVPVDSIKTYVGDNKLDGFVDASILPGGGEIREEQELLAVTKLALRCIQSAAEYRPTMVDIAKELRQIQRDIWSYVTSTTTLSNSPTAPMNLMENPLNQFITVKLNCKNYLVWKDEVQNAVRSHDLEGFILGTRAVPPALIQNEDREQIMNPDYIMYQRLDRMLASLILASVTPSLLPKLVGCATARDIWNTVEHICTS